MSATSARSLVVTGATGKQGGALIRALLAQPSQPFQIYALTRNKSSKGAQALATKPNVHVIQGSFDQPGDIFKQVQKPWGLFLMTMPMNPVKEEQEGKAMARAALEAGVKHIIFTATDRGGQEKSEQNPTDIAHFRSKFEIEREIAAQVKKYDATYTFLRPVAFFENLAPGFIGKAFVSIWRLNGADRKLQMISTSDIGRIGTEAFLNADSDEYCNKGISIAGDSLTPTEAAQIFKQVTGQEIPWTYSIVGRLIKWILYEQLGKMFDWFATESYGADVPALRKRYPFMQDFKTWLEQDSAWKKA
ncbi:hypothetical protein BAUCODRAFT_138352 [Baudoinia panamericana UAMH 10762]|uniref:NmrA-like domain-containing protein n=1 Tax=Baudoinia panamericana (strain UAMH 10762) TaxID=717646 RepID=M2NCQ2_BAUPA|nr:uncharacterized protein BAUCODRAFT_138352 [Baudoinia panamericana UAMH 10762]EMC96959.1 hypothetical protein BAUCODRAFT_138352 [Baudoinia panamericana UAMH 10762]